MRISREETSKRLLFLKDYFSRDPEASCRSAQEALKSVFGQAMRPLVVSAAKQEVIDAQDAAIQAGFQLRAIPDVGCGGDCSKCSCGGK